MTVVKTPAADVDRGVASVSVTVRRNDLLDYDLVTKENAALQEEWAGYLFTDCTCAEPADRYRSDKQGTTWLSALGIIHEEDPRARPTLWHGARKS